LQKPLSWLLVYKKIDEGGWIFFVCGVSWFGGFGHLAFFFSFHCLYSLLFGGKGKGKGGNGSMWWFGGRGFFTSYANVHVSS
jgi:hypothetical protein